MSQLPDPSAGRRDMPDHDHKREKSWAASMAVIPAHGTTSNPASSITAFGYQLDATRGDTITTKLEPQSPNMLTHPSTDLSVPMNSLTSSSTCAEASSNDRLTLPRESGDSMRPVRSKRSSNSSVLDDNWDSWSQSSGQPEITMNEVMPPSPDGLVRWEEFEYDRALLMEDMEEELGALRLCDSLSVTPSDNEVSDDGPGLKEVALSRCSGGVGWPPMSHLSAPSYSNSTVPGPSFALLPYETVRQVPTLPASEEDKQRNHKRQKTNGSRKIITPDSPLACPFMKRYPGHYWPDVCQTGFSSVSRIKYASPLRSLSH